MISLLAQLLLLEGATPILAGKVQSNPDLRSNLGELSASANRRVVGDDAFAAVGVSTPSRKQTQLSTAVLPATHRSLYHTETATAATNHFPFCFSCLPDWIVSIGSSWYPLELAYIAASA